MSVYGAGNWIHLKSANSWPFMFLILMCLTRGLRVVGTSNLARVTFCQDSPLLSLAKLKLSSRICPCPVIATSMASWTLAKLKMDHFWIAMQMAPQIFANQIAMPTASQTIANLIKMEMACPTTAMTTTIMMGLKTDVM